MPETDDLMRRISELEERCRQLEAGLAAIIDAVAGQVDVHAETARAIETLTEQMLELKGASARGPKRPGRDLRSTLRSIPGGKDEADDGDKKE